MFLTTLAISAAMLQADASVLVEVSHSGVSNRTLIVGVLSVGHN